MITSYSTATDPTSTSETLQAAGTRHKETAVSNGSRESSGCRCGAGMMHAVNCDAMAFWQQREGSYPNLSPIAVDHVSALASQAYIERVFSTCGDLCARKRNRATTGHENKVFLKANKKLFNK